MQLLNVFFFKKKQIKWIKIEILEFLVQGVPKTKKQKKRGQNNLNTK